MVDFRDIHLLGDFIVVCRTRSISAAARELNTVQSAVTQRIHRLEQACDTQLLTRHSRGVSPTGQGKVLLQFSEKIESLLYEANQEMHDWLSSPSGKVTIGMPPSITPVLATPLIENFTSELPNIDLSVTEAMSGYLEGWLENGDTDFSIVFQRPRKAGIHATPLLDEDLFLIVTPDLAAGLPSTVSIQDIAQLPLVAPSRMHSTRHMLESAASEAGLELHVLSIDAGNLLIRQSIIRKMGMVLSRAAAAPELEAGSLVAIPITKPKFTRTAYLLERREASGSHLINVARLQILSTVSMLVKQRIWKGRPRSALSDPIG